MRIKFIVVAVMLALCILLPACQTDGSSTSGIESTQSISGGQDLGSDANLKDISVASDGKTTVISMSFIKGSRKSTVNETKLNAVPKYNASLLSFPQRLRITLNVDYWDYHGCRQRHTVGNLCWRTRPSEASAGKPGATEDPGRVEVRKDGI
jgi:hypothetical protein